MEKEAIQRLVQKLKHSCFICSVNYNYRNIDDRAFVQENLAKLAAHYDELIREARKNDLPGSEVTKRREKKIKILDLIDQCKACQKEFAYVNRELPKIVQ